MIPSPEAVAAQLSLTHEEAEAMVCVVEALLEEAGYCDLPEQDQLETFHQILGSTLAKMGKLPDDLRIQLARSRH
jgi:hypothetical protein